MSIIATGELKDRIEANARRLSDKKYCYPDVFQPAGYGWDGDWEGRTILALCSIYNANVGEYSEQALNQVKNIVEHLETYVNEDSYFGKKFDGVTVNEQQLSGNSWFLRGLCEYYKIVKDASILSRIQRICDTLICAVGEFYGEYPLCEREDGGVGGHIEKVSNGHWLLSSDVGCAFIFLDGVTAAYELYPEKKLYCAIEKIIDKFLTLDFVKLHCQTHATLSGTRGLIRFAELTGNKKFYAEAERIFDLYLKYGMTVNYANYNWFGKPYWTEPCAVVDSLIVAQKLFMYTRKQSYLELVSRIYRNAIRSGQRSNGGAGCETCLTSECNAMKMHLFEAFFCCSMRLAEGLFAVSSFLALTDGDEILLNLVESYVFEEDGVHIRMNCNSKKEGTIEISVTSEKARNVRIYMPKNTVVEADISFKHKENEIEFLAEKGKYCLRYRFTTYTEELQGHTVHFTGDDLLTRKNEESEFTPIESPFNISEEKLSELVQYFW